MRLTALIPAHNDAYTLAFCLASIVHYFDEIIVLDDASTDETPDVALGVARQNAHIRYSRHEGAPLGWVEARNRLLAMTDSDYLFWLDADDVLCEYNAHLLHQVAGSNDPVVRLQLCEMWGDFYHTTQRLRHYDRCHVYVNRGAMRDFCWSGGSAARPETAVKGVNGPGPLFFHLKGVKPDARIVERSLTRKWLRGKLDRPPAQIVAEMACPEHGRRAPDEVHTRALKVLLTSRQDHLRATYISDAAGAAPRRPEVIERALPGRFRIVYDRRLPADRVDHAISQVALPLAHAP